MVAKSGILFAKEFIFKFILHSIVNIESWIGNVLIVLACN